MRSKQHDIDGDGFLRVRLLDLFVAISPKKTNKNLGQQVETYVKVLKLAPPKDFKRKRFPPSQRGSEAVWLSWDAAKTVYDYEVRH